MVNQHICQGFEGFGYGESTICQGFHEGSVMVNQHICQGFEGFSYGESTHLSRV